MDIQDRFNGEMEFNANDSISADRSMRKFLRALKETLSSYLDVHEKMPVFKKQLSPAYIIHYFSHDEYAKSLLESLHSLRIARLINETDLTKIFTTKSQIKDRIPTDVLIDKRFGFKQHDERDDAKNIRQTSALEHLTFLKDNLNINIPFTEKQIQHAIDVGDFGLLSLASRCKNNYDGMNLNTDVLITRLSHIQSENVSDTQQTPIDRQKLLKTLTLSQSFYKAKTNINQRRVSRSVKMDDAELFKHLVPEDRLSRMLFIHEAVRTGKQNLVWSNCDKFTEQQIICASLRYNKEDALKEIPSTDINKAIIDTYNDPVLSKELFIARGDLLGQFLFRPVDDLEKSPLISSILFDINPKVLKGALEQYPSELGLGGTLIEQLFCSAVFASKRTPLENAFHELCVMQFSNILEKCEPKIDHNWMVGMSILHKDPLMLNALLKHQKPEEKLLTEHYRRNPEMQDVLEPYLFKEKHELVKAARLVALRHPLVGSFIPEFLLRDKVKVNHA